MRNARERVKLIKIGFSYSLSAKTYGGGTAPVWGGGGFTEQKSKQFAVGNIFITASKSESEQ